MLKPGVHRVTAMPVQLSAVLAADAEGTLAVTPGQTLYINAGGGGTTTISGGFNGGGAAGTNAGGHRHKAAVAVAPYWT
ncbi:MAG: hypothetical protein IPL50_19310 [Chitinophagaceae bacterium]|nr:hypothetical protein [Chitinophagaceae bacterium]